jgi:hypothetical protein
MYVEHFHPIHVHLPSTKARSRNSCEGIGIYIVNVTELLTGQIPNQPQCRLAGTCTVPAGTCTVPAGKNVYFY